MAGVQPSAKFGGHKIHVWFREHGRVIAGNSKEVHATLDQVNPSHSEVKIRSLRPIARLEQCDLSRVRLRLIAMKRRMNDEIRIVGPVPISIPPTHGRQLPYGSFNFAPCFVQSIE